MRYTCIIAFTGSLVESSNPVHRSSPQSSPAIRDSLESMGFKVLAVCCDGLAANCRLFSLHESGSTTVYKVLNPHAHDGEKQYIFFLSDPPHLMKTVRNCWANHKQKMWVSIPNK